jgi:beta-glucosidase
VQGAQEHVIATPKHFAVNSIEDTRFDVDMTVDERTLRELYLPHFKAVSDAGAGAIMSAYNSVNGAYCAENKTLLTDILKDEWGFEGFVMSDWIWGTHETIGAANAGLDVEMPGGVFFADPLVDAVNAGDVTQAQIDNAVRRILTAKLRFGLDALEAVPAEKIEAPEHVALALEAALASMVLLKNDSALPFEDIVNSITVIGPLADVTNLGDAGSSNATPSYAIDPLTGIQAAADAHGVGIIHSTDAASAAFTDAAIVVVGLTSDDEGEQIPLFPGGDRDDLLLHAEDIALIEEVASWNERVVVVMEGGSAITVEGWIDSVEGLVMAWYPGMEGGTALGQLLFGDANFEGRLPISVPVNLADLPPFDHVSDAVTYDYLHGYRHLDANGVAARYPFGFGLSYTTFAYDAATLDAQLVSADGTLSVTVEVTNTGSQAGAEVVQVYVVSQVAGSAPRDLRAFQKVWLAPGEQSEVTLEIPIDGLQHWDGGWKLGTDFTAEVGPSHADIQFSLPFSVSP